MAHSRATVATRLAKDPRRLKPGTAKKMIERRTAIRAGFMTINTDIATGAITTTKQAIIFFILSPYQRTFLQV